MQKFVSLPSVKNQHNAAGLRKLFDQVESSVRNLKSLKVETNSYGSLLVPLLNEKLPNDMRERIARKFDKNVWSLDDMLNLLKRELALIKALIQTIERKEEHVPFVAYLITILTNV